MASDKRVQPTRGHGSASRTNRKVPARAWRLSLLAALAGIAAGGLAILLAGTPRAAFASAAVVFLVTAFVSVGITALESHGHPPFDPDEPRAEPPVARSRVTLIYDPKAPPKSSPERDAG